MAHFKKPQAKTPGEQEYPKNVLEEINPIKKRKNIDDKKHEYRTASQNECPSFQQNNLPLLILIKRGE